MTTLSQRTMATAAGIAVALVTSPGWATGLAVARSTFIPDADVAGLRLAANEESAYTDGVYTATGQYGGGPSFITVTVTLADDVITAVSVTPHATNPTSLDFQRRFAAAVPQVVVGKRIEEANVGRLAGSSGTPDGFNAALELIKEQARRARPS